jgi:hypothetical protein
LAERERFVFAQRLALPADFLAALRVGLQELVTPVHHDDGVEGLWVNLKGTELPELFS